MSKGRWKIKGLPSPCFLPQSYLQGQPIARWPRSIFHVHQGLPLALMLGMAILGCQHAYVTSPSTGRDVSREEALSRLRSRESSLKGMQGVADLELSAPTGIYRGKEVFSVELPDRFRFESLNFLGFSDWVVCSDGQEVHLYLSSERKIIRGKLTRENLQRMFSPEIPLYCLLRILMGHSPLPLEEAGASWITIGKGKEVALGSEGPAPIRQRLWFDEASQTLRQGEIIDEEGVWLSFRCKDYREINGFTIPFRFDIHLKRQGIRLQLIHREVRTNPSFDADAFHLALPLTDEIAVLNLEDLDIIEDSRK